MKPLLHHQSPFSLEVIRKGEGEKGDRVTKEELKRVRLINSLGKDGIR